MTEDEAAYEDYRFGGTEYDPLNPHGLGGEDEPDSSDTEDQLRLVRMTSRASFAIGRWAGSDPVKTYAGDVVLGHQQQDTSAAAQRLHVTPSMIRRRIREARTLIQSGVYLQNA